MSTRDIAMFFNVRHLPFLAFLVIFALCCWVFSQSIDRTSRNFVDSLTASKTRLARKRREKLYSIRESYMYVCSCSEREYRVPGQTVLSARFIRD